MRLRLLHMPLLHILLFSQSHGFAQDMVHAADPLFHEKVFLTDGSSSVFSLDHRFIVPGSVIVMMDSLVLDESSDYELDFLQGTLQFPNAPDPGHRLHVEYRSLPLTLPLSFRHWVSADTIPQLDTVTVAGRRYEPRRIQESQAYASQLQRSGTIFRGISIGTDQGMRLQSGLRLQVSGNIAPNINVVASLTDQNTPIQPEGDTQTLQEIDKVFVNLNMPGFRATLGDYVLRLEGTEFGNYSRKIQGAMGIAESARGSFSAAAAATRGEFTTQHFQGREGNQGPYQLTGTKGNREIIVLAGTERVWIDGEPMTRGEENDYVIEYGNGQITFTRNRLITDDSRITVDFEYSDQQYPKEIYGVRGELNLWEGRLKLLSSFLRESDNKDQPLETPLSDEDKEILALAGDNPDSALVSGITYVGTGKGNYRKVDSAGVVLYVYVGADSGDHTARFSYVGQGNGDYRFQGYGIYSYEGAGEGSYLPVVYLPVASRHQTVTMASSLELADGVLIEGELGFSDRDLNTYSNVDDGDNIDVAFSGRVRVDHRPLKLLGAGLGEIGLEGRFRRVGDDFRAVGRVTEVEHGRKWGVDEGVYWGERVGEIRGTYKPIPAWTIEGEWGDFIRGESFHSARKSVSTTLVQPKYPQMAYRAELIETGQGQDFEGYWLRQRGSVEGRLWHLIPSIRYEGEHRREAEQDSIRYGFRFDEWTAGLEFRKKGIRGSIEESIRDDRVYGENHLKRNSLARTDRFRMDIGWFKGVSSSIMVTHRFRDYSEPGMMDQKADLADMKIKVAPGKRFFDGSLSYRYSSTQISEMVTDTIDVGEGLGGYRFDSNLGEIVPDPDGNLILRQIQTGTFLPVNELKLGGDIRMDGNRLWVKRKGLLGVLGALKSRTLIRIERRDRERDFIEVNRSAFRPLWGSDTTTVAGTLSLLQDVEYSHPSKRFSMRLRTRTNDSENHQVVREGLVRRLVERSVRIKSNPFQKMGIFFEYQNRDELKQYTARPASDRDIRLHAWTLEISFRPRQKIELGLKSKVRFAKDVHPDPSQTAASVFLIPRLGYSFQGRGHLRAEMEIGEVQTESGDRTLPYEMLSGDQPGHTLRWNLLFTYRISGHVMANLNYRGRREPWRDRLIQTGQVEVRAFF